MARPTVATSPLYVVLEKKTKATLMAMAEKRAMTLSDLVEEILTRAARAGQSGR
jgi:hypothetical protein